MSEKPFKLRQVEIKPDGSATYERIEERTVEDYLEELRAITAHIAKTADQAIETVDYLQDAIKDKVSSLDQEQRTALKELAFKIAPAAFLASATPNLDREELAQLETEQLETAVADSVGGGEPVVRISLTGISASEKTTQPISVEPEKVSFSNFESTSADRIDRLAEDGVEQHALDSVSEMYAESSTFRLQVEAYKEKIDARERNSSELTVLKNRWNSPVTEGSSESKYDFLERNLHFSNKIPEEAQEVFRSFAAGHCSTESGVDNIVSPANAKGYWQFLEPTFRELGGDVDKIGDFEESTKIRNKKLEEDFISFDHGILNKAQFDKDNKLEFVKRAGGEQALKVLKDSLSKEDYAVFKALIVLVVYNQGQNRVSEAVVVGVNDLGVPTINPFDLLALYVSHAKDSKEGLLSKFGPDGEGYVKKIVSYSHSFDEFFDRKNSSKLAQK